MEVFGTITGVPSTRDSDFCTVLKIHRWLISPCFLLVVFADFLSAQSTVEKNLAVRKFTTTKIFIFKSKFKFEFFYDFDD